MKKMIVLIALILLINVVSAKAEVFGGKWNYSPTYYIASTNAYYSNVTTSVSRWNVELVGISAGISIQYAGILSAVVGISTNAYGNVGWNAQGSSGPVLTSGTYTYGSIKINTTYMDSYTSAKKSAICTHEWGHVLGIAHTMSSSINSLMYYGGSSVYYDNWGIYAPTVFDVTQLDQIY